MRVFQVNVRGQGPADAALVDALARFHLALKQAGCELQICGACDQLRDLIAFMGLDEVLWVEPGRKPKQREEVLGVQEERDPVELSVTDVEDLD